MKKQIDIIKEECKKYDLNIYEVFREAKVPFATIGNWDRKEPAAFETKRKVEKAIQLLKKKK